MEASAGDVLALGGDGAGAFYLGQVGEQYRGFSSLEKTGAGVWEISGSADFAGSSESGAGVFVKAGELRLADAGLGARVRVQSGGILAGQGRIGAAIIDQGATLAPALAGGITVQGDLRFQPGAVYRVELDPVSSASSKVTVNGHAYLDGSVVYVGDLSRLQAQQRYTILSAEQLHGSFASHGPDFAFLDVRLAQNQTEVSLSLERKQVTVPPDDTPGQPPVDPVKQPPVYPSTQPVAEAPPTRPIRFEDAAVTVNQRGVAQALDRLPRDNPLHQYVLKLPSGQPAGVFDQLSGEGHASAATALMAAASMPGTLSFQRLRVNLAPFAQAGLSSDAQAGLPAGSRAAGDALSAGARPVWVQTVGSWRDYAASSGAAAMRERVGGVHAGADRALGGGWRLGGALGYTEGKLSIADRGMRSDTASYSATVYGGRAFAVGDGTLSLALGATLAWHDIDTRRELAVAGQGQVLTASYGAVSNQLHAELGYALPWPQRLRLEPYAAASWLNLHRRGFTETGGSAALTGERGRDAQASTTLGLRLGSTLDLGRTAAALRAMAGWRHAYGAAAPTRRMVFASGSDAFTVTGAPLARDAALFELGVDATVSRSLTAGLGYTGQFGGGNREHGGSVALRWRF